MDAVWIWLYGTAAQKATYGRFNEDGEQAGFTKDFLQLSGSNGDLLASRFPLDLASGRHELRLHSPGGIVEAGFVSHSADRKHLAWPMNRPPAAWRMATKPSAAGPSTIPGNPDRSNFTDAQRELANFGARKITAYLIAVKIKGDETKLHLRAYLKDAPLDLQFAAIDKLPTPIAVLLDQFTGNRACVSSEFSLADHLYFDPAENHDAWTVGLLPPAAIPAVSDDAAAEALGFDAHEVTELTAKVATGDFSAPDVPTVSRSRGSQQKVFADAVKRNYSYRCALTGISTVEFLVASHIVPWAQDKTIRLDPANGICLSTLVDRAFDTDFLRIDVDYIAHVDWTKVGDDHNLRSLLQTVDGRALTMPKTAPPKVEHLRRRLEGFETAKVSFE